MTADERWEKLKGWLQSSVDYKDQFHLVNENTFKIQKITLACVLDKMKQLEGK